MSKPIDAITAGLKRGGATRAYNFPGFHSHEIAAGLGMTQISLNERTAYAEAYGACVAGARTVVTFKNVGLNVAADAFLHSIIGGVGAGLVVIVTDDTLVVGSQEFQDSRHYADFYGGLWFDPADPQDAYDIAKAAFSLSEQFDVPVVIRLSGQYFDSDDPFFDEDEVSVRAPAHTALMPERHVVHPYYYREQAKRLEKKRRAIAGYVETCAPSIPAKTPHGVIVCGAASYTGDDDVLHLSTIPIPAKIVAKFLETHDTVTVYEDGDPYVKHLVAQIGSRATVVPAPQQERGVRTKFVKWKAYESIFSHINEVLTGAYVAGDITQFTVETTDTIGVALSLGVAVGTAIGMADVAGEAYAIVGDTSFLHEGKGIVQEAQKRGVHVGIIIIDNAMSWCTGGQEAADDLNQTMAQYQSWTVDARDGDVSELKTALHSMRDTSGVSIVRVLVPYVAPIVRN